MDVVDGRIRRCADVDGVTHSDVRSEYADQRSDFARRQHTTDPIAAAQGHKAKGQAAQGQRPSCDGGWGGVT